MQDELRKEGDKKRDLNLYVRHYLFYQLSPARATFKFWWVCDSQTADRFANLII